MTRNPRTIAILAVILVAVAGVGVVTAQTASFTLDSTGPSSVSSGDTIQVNYTIQNTGSSTLSSLALRTTNVSNNLTITSISSPDSVATTVQPGKHSVAFENIDPGNVTYATFTVDVGASASGANEIEVEAVNGFGSEEVTKTDTSCLQVDVTVPSLTANPVTDEDCDGKFENVNGDTTLNILDVVALYNNLGSSDVTNNVSMFDFNGDNQINILDVVALYNQIS